MCSSSAAAEGAAEYAADDGAAEDAAGNAAHEALIQFLYQAPIGLVQTAVDGTITMVNPMSAQLLMPLSRDGSLDNLFDVLEPLLPDLRPKAAASDQPGDVICSLRRL